MSASLTEEEMDDVKGKAKLEAASDCVLTEEEVQMIYDVAQASDEFTKALQEVEPSK